MKQLKTHDGVYINTAHIMAVYQIGCELTADIAVTGVEYSLGEFAAEDEAEEMLAAIAHFLRDPEAGGYLFEIPRELPPGRGKLVYKRRGLGNAADIAEMKIAEPEPDNADLCDAAPKEPYLNATDITEENYEDYEGKTVTVRGKLCDLCETSESKATAQLYNLDFCGGHSLLLLASRDMMGAEAYAAFKELDEDIPIEVCGKIGRYQGKHIMIAAAEVRPL